MLSILLLAFVFLLSEEKCHGNQLCFLLQKVYFHIMAFKGNQFLFLVTGV